MATASITKFGLQSGTDKTLFASWEWATKNTESFRVIWRYDTGDGVWFTGSDSNVKTWETTYSIPDNAKKVKFKVKPISKKRTVKNTETSYWTAEWSTEQIYNVSDLPPSKPTSAPNVEIKDFKLTASLDNQNLNATHIQFQIIKNDTTVFNTGKAEIKISSASYSCTIVAGAEYKVRCRAVRGEDYSDWTEYSQNYSTKPSASSGITKLQAKSETSVYLEWGKVANATSYDIEYATKKEYFDGSNQTTSQSGIETTHFELGGLETGQEYFFRVRAVNDQGDSSWSSVKSVSIGKTPAAPTTWSSTTTATVGNPLTLYWMHNAEDGSSQTFAEVEVTIGTNTDVHTIRTIDQPDDEKTMYFAVDTSKHAEGTKIKWRVRTAGVTKTYGEWSMLRTVDIYAPPSLSLRITDSNTKVIETLTSFPFYISGTAGPNTQTPIGFHVSITSNSSYETVDNVGNERIVSSGEEVYSRHYDISENLLAMLSAGDVDLANNVTYTVTCTVSMDSGLTAEASSEFKVAWTDVAYEPNAEIGIDPDTISAIIRPYCEDKNGNMVEGVTLSVYRREYDGTFTELMTGLKNEDNTFITDPHPALDFARYRVVAVTDATGAVSFSDIPGYPVGESAIVMQWNEDWSYFDTDNADASEEPVWSGSMLKLPYNIDVSDDYSPDVSLVEYIGREHPVSYYGTQRGESSTWNTVIDRNDEETLYAIRRLSRWMGDVYVREPSGTGYWANVTVSFSQKHMEVTIPVTFKITRVSGGV